MRTPKERVAWLLAIVFLIAACGGTQSGTTTASTEPSVTVATTAPATATTAPATATTGATTADPMAMECSPVDYAGGPVTLNFVWWVGGGDTASDTLFTDALACFNQRYEGKIEAVVDYVPGGEDYLAKLTTDYAASGSSRSSSRRSASVTSRKFGSTMMSWSISSRISARRRNGKT